MKGEALLKVGELAARVGVGVQTLHYYERLGLLPKPRRSASNYRLYSADTLRRLVFIKKAQALGFALEEIKEIFSLRQRGNAPCRPVVEIGRRHLRELDARISELQEYQRLLAAIVPKWEEETVRQRSCAGEFCDLIETLHQPEAASGPKNGRNAKRPLTL
jgi:DNA-binding transcriptional MerR regulator